METIVKKIALKKRILAFIAAVAVLAGGVVAGVQADTAATGTLQVDVVDANGTPLAGAKLQIVDADNVIQNDFESNGQTQEFTLEAGSYYLHEVKAPEGYEVAEDVPFEVVASETVHTEIKQNAPPAGDVVNGETRSVPAEAKGALSDVYVGGANANDANDGSKESPVATWNVAKTLAKSDGTIYIAGTLGVEGDISAEQVVKRAPGFTGDMFNVKGSANFTNIHITGNGETATGSAIVFSNKGKGNALVVGKGVVIDNLVSSGEGAAVRAENDPGASITFDGAQFLKNTSKNGGAVSIRTAPQNNPSKGFTVNITGGTIFDGNVAKQTNVDTGQGGAVFLNGQFVTNIDNATFKNNVAQYGAAIVNYNHYIGNEINIINGLIANNTTGQGTPTNAMGQSGLSAGGVNICMAGAAEVNISSENGVAIFDNKGPKGDIGVWDNSDASKLKVNEGAMLGGGNHNWKKSETEKGYIANPTAADKTKARNSATTIFENNTSDYHGTIMSNGIVQFGTKLAELRIRKVDASTNQVMGGVVFKLTSENGVKRTATTFVEAGGEEKYQGVASFTDLPDGKYKLEEVVPAGYIAAGPWNVTIENQQAYIEDLKPVEGQYYGYVILNHPIIVKISKQELGVDTQELPGAQIKVTGPDGFVEEWTSGNEPHEFAAKPGNYTLVEVAAPALFEKITTTIKFSVNEKGEVTVTNAQEVTNGRVTVRDVNHLVLEDRPLPPSVTTDAKDAADGDKYVAPTGTAKVTDVVTYKNLKPGVEYTVTGELHKKVNGKDAGVIATKTVTFTPEKSDGSIEITFEFDASKLAGQTLVAFESVKRDNVEVASHTDINDEDQTVRVVKIGTIATDGTTEDHIGLAAEKTVLNDVVAYEGLKPGAKYTVKGKLVKRADGSDIGATAEATFTASATGKGTVVVTFKYDARPLEGFASVAYEYLYEGDRLITKHEDRLDENQTVYYPNVTTQAKDQEDKDKVLYPEKDVTVVDVVTYTNLIPGKEYTVSGELHIKNADGSDGGVLEVNGTAVTASKTFTPDARSGSVELTFTFNASALNEKKLVAFETVTYSGKEVAVHKDINDEDQTVEISKKPSVGTYAKDGNDGDKLIEKAEGQKIVDTVTYSNLNTARTYRVDGVLMDKATGEPVVINGEQVTATATFQPEAADGNVEVTFTVDGNAVAGKNLVVFETLYLLKGEAADVVAEHKNINDDDQTVHVKDTPEIEKYVNKTVHQEIDLNEVFTYDVLAYVTKDADKVVITDTLNDDLQFVSAAGDVTVVDLGETVDHKPYGSVAADGAAVADAQAVIDGQTLTVTIEPAEAYRGHWVKVTFDAKIADGKKIEDLKYATVKENTPVLTDEQHEGVPNKASYIIEVDNKGLYKDESNTVTVNPAKIGTVATSEDGGKTIFADGDVTVYDTVAYEGLETGKTYTLKGVLVKKADGEVVATTEATFVAESNDKRYGFTQVSFTVNASDVSGGALVAYEYLYAGDVTGQDVNEGSEEFVTKHEDINDEKQTVYFPSVGTVATTECEETPEVPEATEAVVSEATEETAEVEANQCNNKAFTIRLNDVKDVTITDTIKYSGLVPGEKYTVRGQLVAKTDEQPVIAESAGVFTASDTGAGEWTLEFTFNTKDIPDAVAEMVVFEYLFDGDVTAEDIDLSKAKEDDKYVAEHADIDDEAQTVTVQHTYPTIELATTATDAADGDKVLETDSNATVKDVVAFTGLAIGKPYTIRGKLVVKGTEGKFIVAESEAVFVPETEDGETEVFFTFNTAGLDGKELVAYEYLFKGDVLGTDVTTDNADAWHADDNDASQTVSVKKKVTPPTPKEKSKVKLPITGLPRTGSAILAGALTSLILIGSGMLILRRRRNG